MSKKKDRKINRRWNVVTEDTSFQNVRAKYGHGFLQVYREDGSRYVTNGKYTINQVMPEEPKEEPPKEEPPKEETLPDKD